MDKIAAEAAQEIADMVARWEGGGVRVDPSSFVPTIQFDPSSFVPIIQSALSQSLAEREQRIAKLEHVCRVAISMCELCEDGRVRRYYTNAGGYDMVPCPCCGKARAALAATEGEKR